jgi:hypothetical protein
MIQVTILLNLFASHSVDTKINFSCCCLVTEFLIYFPKYRVALVSVCYLRSVCVEVPKCSIGLSSQ